MAKDFRGFVGAKGAGPATIYTHACLGVESAGGIRRRTNNGYSYITEFSAEITLEASHFDDCQSGLKNSFPRPPKTRKGEDHVVLATTYGTVYDHRTRWDLQEIYDWDDDTALDLLRRLLAVKVRGRWCLPNNFLESTGGKTSVRDFNRNVWIWEANVKPMFKGLRLEAYAVAAIADRFATPGDMLTVSVPVSSAVDFRRALPDLLAIPDWEDVPHMHKDLFHAVDERMFLSEV